LTVNKIILISFALGSLNLLANTPHDNDDNLDSQWRQESLDIALIKAVRNNEIEWIIPLVSDGANVQCCEGSQTLIDIAFECENKNTEAMSRLLYRLGAKSIDSKNQNPGYYWRQESLNIALLKAVRNGDYIWIVPLFIQGADLRCQDENGNTPLSLAQAGHQRGHKECAQILIELGADKNVAFQETIRSEFLKIA
jgi:ankyrin repeat protein